MTEPQGWVIAVGAVLAAIIVVLAFLSAREARRPRPPGPQYRLRIRSTKVSEGRYRWELRADKIVGAGYWSTEPQPWAVRFADGDVEEGRWVFDFRGKTTSLGIADGESDAPPVGGWAGMRPYGNLGCRDVENHGDNPVNPD